MVELAWQISSGTNKFWVQIMRAKYTCGPFITPSMSSKTNVSSVWRAIQATWPTVATNISLIIRDGNEARFWKDKWIPSVGILEDRYAASIPPAELDFPVSFYAFMDGWHWERLQQMLPAESGT